MRGRLTVGRLTLAQEVGVRIPAPQLQFRRDRSISRRDRMSRPRAHRVTCICTAYNVGAYVRDAIASALAQDYEGELEIIAVDDGSTDATGAILDELADRITVVHQTNTGFLGAVDAGLALATGDYIALLDGDDEWPAEKVRRQAEFLDANSDVGLVFGDMEVIDENGAPVHESFWRFEN